MFTTRPEIRGTFGVVASTHWLASSAGMAILERGGNAFDAAVAAGFVLQIVEPHLNGPGGDLPLIMHSAKQNRTQVICGQGPAPKAATIPAIRDLGLDLIPGSGLLAAVTPGAFDTWMLMLRDHGTMGLGDVLEYAIGYARNGYPVVPKITDTVETVRGLFETEWTTSAAIYLKDGKAPTPGAMFSNPKLADTYERIVREAETGGGNREAQIDRARDIWYRGWIAETIDRFCQDAYMDATGRRHKALLTGDDLASWSATYEDALTYDYGRYTVAKCGAWSQGPVMLQQLSLLKSMGIADMDPTGPDFVHAVTETSKLSYADREAYYGDPDFVDVPMETLLSDAYAESRRALVGKDASDAFIAGTIEGYSNNISHSLLPHAQDISGAGMGVGEPTVGKMGEARGDTVHIDIIDKHGNMVSATPSGGWLQSSPIIPELGFCLGNRAQMFWLEEGSPSTLAPGKRPRTTLSPSFALRDGEAYMPFGTPGGDQQDQWSLLLFLHHADHGMNLQEAIDCPAFHNEHFPSSFWPRGRINKRLVLEDMFPAETYAELRRRGHDLEVGDPWSEGRLTAAAKDGDMLRAAANPRGMQGYAVGR
ncbi:gamma-glutamyltransferase family protein [uncultured Nisaea sp.]|jgi:gamma-glutamyltranspeptidase / glutathione hydrolase|uniref:gamma-glutamyltransferase family protein n=1 Tax=uncultured Nisaea sp. TaxID=538215 RepID=UPI0030EF4EDC|tara:strand:+ start:228 stop:2009 length:1782 start_codon:yes stop_codon:yes gene_type:complete